MRAFSRIWILSVMTLVGPVCSTGAATSAAAAGGRDFSSLICGAFLAGGLKSADLSAQTPRNAAVDPQSAIQFGQIWAGGREAIVGRTSDAGTQSVMATIKLPIVFTDAERRRFQDAGWVSHFDRTTHKNSYCLVSHSPAAKGSGSSGGSLCVMEGP